MHSFIWIFFGTVLVSAVTDAAKILVIFPIPAKSHVGAYQPLMEELAKRGHEMTVVTAFPRKTPLKNYNEIIYKDTFPPRNSSIMNYFELKQANVIIMMYHTYLMVSDSCGKLVKQPNIQNLIHSTDKDFDLIIYTPFLSECLYGILHKYKVPNIQMFPNTIIPWIDDLIGNPSTLSYVPDVMSQSENMDFKDRLISFVEVQYSRIFRHLMIRPRMESIMRESFPDPTIPSIYEIEKNPSLLMLHSHPALSFPRPFTPNTIDVAGLHIKTSNNLPKELKAFLDSAPHGVVYFSLGSNVRSVDMPEEMRNSILRSFSKLKQRVLWKWEADNLPGQPENVRLSKWFPQHDILAHPNVKLFITHGGLMSLQEATYFGVPMISIPIMGDQKFNALRARNSGYAVLLEVQNITETSFDWALKEVLQEPSYRERAQELSRIFQDQPQKPLDRAVYWVEYVIRHKGAPHMRSGALDLNFIQYYLLDVISLILLVTSVSIIVLLKTITILINCLFRKSTEPKLASKNKKHN